MKLVIEIPDDVYKHTVERSEYDTLSFGYSLMNAVANGKPLPKGHGDLIDRDTLEVDTEWDGYVDGFISYSQMQIESADVIIEADKEG